MRRTMNGDMRQRGLREDVLDDAKRWRSSLGRRRALKAYNQREKQHK